MKIAKEKAHNAVGTVLVTGSNQLRINLQRDVFNRR